MNLGVVRALLEAGANPNGGPGDYPPLFRAAGAGHSRTVRLLLERGADPARRHGGKSALEYAQSRGREEIASILSAV